MMETFKKANIIASFDQERNCKCHYSVHINWYFSGILPVNIDYHFEFDSLCQYFPGTKPANQLLS